MRIASFFALAGLIFLQACTGSRLHSGDLIFIALPSDYSLDADAPEPVSETLNIIHVAIADVGRDGVSVIDATLAHGVERHPLDTLLSDFTLKDGKLPPMMVYRLKDNREARRFVSNARAFTGLPYDIDFKPGNDARYCTELVQDSYITASGDSLFKTVPLDFSLPGGEIPQYWSQLFAIIGRPIPEGPGYSPQTMMDSPLLKFVKNL